MLVKIKNVRRQNKKDRHGWKVDFKVDDAAEDTVIYQNVYVNIKSSDGDWERYTFTEAWPYSHTRKVTDSFLVPLDWRKDLNGRLKVSAIAWALPGPMDPSLRKGTGLDYWGNLHGSFDLKAPTSKTSKRKVVIEWENEGLRAAKHYTDGKDLALTKNTVIY